LSNCSCFLSILASSSFNFWFPSLICFFRIFFYGFFAGSASNAFSTSSASAGLAR
jgi:hypothetical protein